MVHYSAMILLETEMDVGNGHFIGSGMDEISPEDSSDAGVLKALRKLTNEHIEACRCLGKGASGQVTHYLSVKGAKPPVWGKDVIHEIDVLNQLLATFRSLETRVALYKSFLGFSIEGHSN